MSQQLQARGHTVDLLVALDCAPFNTGGESSRWNPLYHWKLLCNFPRWLADSIGSDLTWKTDFSWIRNKLVAVVKKTVAALWREEDLAKYEVQGWLKSSDYSQRQLQFSQSLFSALHRYFPKAYKGRVVVYQSKTQPLYHLFEVDRCWRKLAPQVEIVPVKGTHVSLIDQFHVDPIAQHLAQRLSYSPILRRAPVCRAPRMQFVESAVKEDETRYHALSVAAHELSQWIAEGPRPTESQSAACLWKAAVESVLHPPRDIG